MRKIGFLMIGAMLGSALSVTTSTAAPRGGASLLSRCIANYNACVFNCTSSPLPPVDWSWKYCLNQCDANHAACVDAAFTYVARSGNWDALRPKRLRPPKVSKQQPK